MTVRKDHPLRNQYADTIDVYLENILQMKEQKVVSGPFASFLISFVLKRKLAKEVQDYLQMILFEKRRKETYTFMNYESKHTEFRGTV